jgi:hypothetical protein
VGFVVNADGAALHLFKDSRSGKVVSLSESASKNGWAFVSKEEDGFVISVDGERYLVPAEVTE